MPIKLNIQDSRDRVNRLHGALSAYWKVAKNARQSGTSESYSHFFSQATKNQSELNRLLTANSFASEKAIFQESFGWDDTTWNTFLSEADDVHGTLVPDAIATMKANESEFSKAGLNATSGDRTFGAPSAAAKTAIDADLLAIESEFVV